MTQAVTVFRGGRAVLDGGLAAVDVTLEEDRIREVGSAAAVDCATIVDLEGKILAPGLIDLHLNGFAGHEVCDASTEQFEAMLAALPSHGCTAALFTLGSAPRARYGECFAALRGVTNPAGARPLGLHVEGPYLAERYRGAHKSGAVRAVDLAELDELLDEGGDLVRLMTIAPELPGALDAIGRIVARGVVAAIGHCEPSRQAIDDAVAHGATTVTHLFNAMPSLTHKQVGLVDVALLHDSLRVTLIPDGWHVTPTCLRIADQLCEDRLVLITDAIGAAGAAAGRYVHGGIEYSYEGEGQPGRLDDGVLIGSTIGALEGVRNFSAFTGRPLAASIERMSAHAADALNRGELGRVRAGCLADLLVLDEQGQLEQTWIGGRLVYER